MKNQQINKLTLNPSSPGFSGSKSYIAVQHGALPTAGVRAGELFTGDCNGDATNKYVHWFI